MSTLHGHIVHPFDIAIAVRGRRKQLRLRQAEVAHAAGVGREWLIDLEHGKPTAEVGMVPRTFAALGIELDCFAGRDPPDWTVPLTAAAEARHAKLVANRPPGRPRKLRPGITPPDDYPFKHLWPGGGRTAKLD